jgi:hypothetical protein
VKSGIPSGSIYGTKSNLVWHDRALDTSCGVALTGSTAFISKGDTNTNDSGTWIEVGWRHYGGCDGPTAWCWFTEKGFNFTAQQNVEYGIEPPAPGTHDVYRVTNRPTNPNGSTDWLMQVDAEPQRRLSHTHYVQ